MILIQLLLIVTGVENYTVPVKVLSISVEPKR